MRTSPGCALPLLAGLLLLLGGAARADDTIYDIQLGVYPPNTVVNPLGVVVTAQGRFGFFAQEPDPHPIYGRQYSGIFVYTNAQPTVVRGDLVNVRGTYMEYFGRSEIDITVGGGSYAKVGAADVPLPVDVTIPEVNNTGAYAEAYEGVLLRVDREDATLFAGTKNAFNEWRLKRDQAVASDWLKMETFSAGADFEYDVPDSGVAVSFAQGILDYNFNEYKLCPRNCDEDLGVACKPKLRGAYATSSTGVAVQFGVPVEEASAENLANYELASGLSIHAATLDPTNHKRVYLVTDDLGNGEQESITVHGVVSDQGVPMAGPETADFRTGITPISMIQFVSNPGTQDASALIGEVVTLRGRVSGIDGSNYYFLQDDNGGEWDGIYVRVARNDPLDVGDQVIVAGRVAESNGMTRLSYTSGVDYFVKLTGTAPVTTTTLTTAALRYRDAAKSAEPWESCLVHLESARLDSLDGVAGPYFREWLLFQQGYPDTSKMDINGINGDKSYDACIGDIVNVTGLLGYSFSEFKIWPRTGRGLDIQVTYDNPACAATAVGEGDPYAGGTGLANDPNPFMPRTTIRFRLATPDQVRLEILDPSGRIVRTLRDGARLQAGEQQIAWDGRDNAGHAVGAGAYFARLQTKDGVTARKLVLVK